MNSCWICTRRLLQERTIVHVHLCRHCVVRVCSRNDLLRSRTYRFHPVHCWEPLPRWCPSFKASPVPIAVHQRIFNHLRKARTWRGRVGAAPPARRDAAGAPTPPRASGGIRGRSRCWLAPSRSGLRRPPRRIASLSRTGRRLMQCSGNDEQTSAFTLRRVMTSSKA